MRIHAFMPCSTVNGPGNRAVVWLQGCKLQCPGCWNPDTHNFFSPAAKAMTPYELAKMIADVQGIEGVTFSGGEPMHQAEDLLATLLHLQVLRPDLTVGMYTGYTRKELDEGLYEVWHAASDWEERLVIWQEISAYLDFAVMGRYNQQQPVAEKPLCTSANQQLVLFSQHYSESDFTPPEVEIVTYEDTAVTQVTGFPVKGAVA